MLGLVGCQSQAPAPVGPPVIRIGPGVLRGDAKRLGINLSGQTFYDSGQMLRNLTFRNPGFEGETWQTILHCKGVTATSCTDENPYAVWKDGFLEGGTFAVISGKAAGAGGQVLRSAAAAGDRGATVQFGNAVAGLAAGDFVLVRVAKPGGAEAGYWTDLQGGARVGTEYKDLAAGSPGRQALRVEAAGAGQTAGVSSYFDSFAGRSFVQLRGRYTLSFRAKALAGRPSVGVRVQRLDTVHGLHVFLDKQVGLSEKWQDFRYEFAGAEDGSAVGTVGLTFTFAGTAALLDDVSLVEAAGPGNPTAFRDAVVEALRTLKPGVLRYMDNGTDFGSSLDNLLAVPGARVRAGASTQETLHEEVPLGLHEFLVLCAAVGADPWFTMPAGTSPEEAVHLAEYLGGDAGTVYGAKRVALGQRAAWTTVFRKIHLELGNEQWNARSFAGATINDPTAYGQRADAVYRAPPPGVFDLILGSWATVPWWTEQEMRSAGAESTVAVAPYLFSEFNDARAIEAVYGPMFAEPEMVNGRAGGYMAETARKVKASGKGLAVYETNLGTMSGTATQGDLDRTVPSLGAGLAVVDHMLLMLRELGVTTQCLFALPEYQNGFTSTNGAKETVPLWGAVVDMGGASNGRRPQYLAMELANEAILPTMLATTVDGAPLTWNQGLSTNGKVQLAGAHLLQSFAFADGDRRSLIVLNLSREKAITVGFTGGPEGEVEESVLAGPDITAGNEAGERVAIRRRKIQRFEGAGYSLPAHSMTVLRWRVGRR